MHIHAIDFCLRFLRFRRSGKFVKWKKKFGRRWRHTDIRLIHLYCSISSCSTTTTCVYCIYGPIGLFYFSFFIDFPLIRIKPCETFSYRKYVNRTLESVGSSQIPRMLVPQMIQALYEESVNVNMTISDV